MTLSKTTSTHIDSHTRLSVQIALTGLSFLVSDALSQKVVCFEHKSFNHSLTPEELLYEMEDMIASHSQLQGPFEQVHLIYATQLYTLVPKSLFDPNKASEYLKFNAKILAGDFISHEEIHNHDAVAVYVPFVNINNRIFDRFGSFEYHHGISLLVGRLHQTEKHATSPSAYIHVLGSNFDLLVFSDGKLVLCNSYTFTTPEDFVYYVLFALEQLQLNPDTLGVQLLGSIQETDDIYTLLYTYIRHLSFYEDGQLKKRLVASEAPHENTLLKISL